ncbi:immunity 49 family protein [Cellulophaga sp. L1A9]|uniref:immunity 49 family protein n=1 Tax=Cellulophaga sp. L1A9 TaxID=2686362 RepID=UPI00131BC5DF|nr:immunity 49 family protein [Cellulophaga sp. L1A9]
MEINKTIIPAEHFERYLNNVNRKIDKLEINSFERFENDVSSNTLGTFAFFILDDFNKYATCPNQDRALQTKALHYFKILAKAFYHLAYSAGTEVTVQFRDKPVQHMGVAYKSNMGFSDWLNTYSIFRVLRDQAGLNVLEGITDSAMDRADAGWTVLHKNMLHFLCSLHSNPKTREKLLIDAIKSTNADSGDYLQEGFAIEFVTYLYEPLLFVYEALLRNNEEDFNAQLIEALTRHKTYYDTKKNNRCNDSDGWISWRLLGAVALAYDNGIKINVKSDYIPEWLYKGEFDTATLPKYMVS